MTHRNRPLLHTYELSDGHAKPTASISVRIVSPTTFARDPSGINVSATITFCSPGLGIDTSG